LAKLLAEACEVPLIQGSVAEFFATTEGHLNDVVKAQRQLFARAEAVAPAILFLDEINAYPSPDSLGGSRNRDYWMPLINDFYMLLDSAMSDREGVVVVGATNRIEDIAPQLLRPGRLERSIEIAAPSPAGLVNILRTHLQGDLKDEDLLPLAVLAEGATAAIAMEWVRSARRLARRAQRAMVLEDLEAQVFGVDTRAPSDLFRAAVHEAGHAVVGKLEGLPALSVSIRRIGATGGRTVFGERPTVMTQSDCNREVRMTLAGRAAERILLRETSSGSGGGAQSDLATATGMVAAMVGAYGFSSTARWAGAPRDLTATLPFDSDLRKQVTADLKKLDIQTHAIVRRFRHEIAQLAEELVLKRTVDLA
jgi:ATP-dependent Zn protease